jgi:hypothetical protein
MYQNAFRITGSCFVAGILAAVTVFADAGGDAADALSRVRENLVAPPAGTCPAGPQRGTRHRSERVHVRAVRRQPGQPAGGAVRRQHSAGVTCCDASCGVRCPAGDWSVIAGATGSYQQCHGSAATANGARGGPAPDPAARPLARRVATVVPSPKMRVAPAIVGMAKDGVIELEFSATGVPAGDDKLPTLTPYTGTCHVDAVTGWVRNASIQQQVDLGKDRYSMQIILNSDGDKGKRGNSATQSSP